MAEVERRTMSLMGDIKRLDVRHAGNLQNEYMWRNRTRRNFWACSYKLIRQWMKKWQADSNLTGGWGWETTAMIILFLRSFPFRDHMNMGSNLNSYEAMGTLNTAWLEEDILKKKVVHRIVQCTEETGKVEHTVYSGIFFLSQLSKSSNTSNTRWESVSSSYDISDWKWPK